MEFGLEDGQPHTPVRPLLSQYRVNGASRGAAEVALLPLGGEDPAAVEADIDTALAEFEATMVDLMAPWSQAWQRDGWASVPKAYLRGLGSGGKAWWEGEVDFWSSVGGAADAAWDGVKHGSTLAWQYFNNLPWCLRNPVGVAIDLGQRLGEAVWESVQALWDRRDDVMALARAFAEGTVDAIEGALEALVDLPGELGELIKDAVENSAHWVQHMIEIARETTVFERSFQTILRVCFLLIPNFWAEVQGTVAGFVIPEVVITVILALIAALATAASGGAASAGAAGAFATRVTTALSKSVR